MMALVAARMGRRAVVLRQREHRGAGKALLEVEDVAHRGGAKGIDRLRVVADARHARAVRTQERDDLGLQHVGVLVLVDEHGVETLAHARAGDRVTQEAVPEEQQVVVVEHLLLFFEVGVTAKRLLRSASASRHQGKLVGSTSASGSCALTQRE
jgi:hypothetical protein